MFDVMSITKAAIGTMYHVHENQYPRNLPLDFTTVGKALNMRVGKEYRDFQFKDFRTKVQTDQNLRAYSANTLTSIPNLKKNEMVYSDLAYQLLASNMPDVAEKFGRFINDETSGKLIEETSDGEILYFKYGKGWKWEHTKSGEPLGPHGLHMTKQTAETFGELAKTHVLHMSDNEKTSCENWLGIGKNHFTHYWNGWFLTETCAYAVGYVCQVIAILSNGAVSQLYKEVWGEKNHNFMDHPNNKWKHPRWFFIQNIQQFQNKYKEQTNQYLNKLQQPPQSQRGASIIMPSGSGKSYYIDRQKNKDEFIDCDPLTWITNAQPHRSNSCPWNWDEHLKIICLQVDQVVAIAKSRRFWVMGATWWSGKQIDAIVILEEQIHRKRFKNKTDPFSDSYFNNTIKNVIEMLEEEIRKYQIPKFDTIEGCVNFIRQNYTISLKF